VRDPAVIFQRLDDGAVLFAPGNESYFGLNEVGALVWEALPPASASLEELCAHLQQRFPDVDLATVRADVVELIDRLATEGLVRMPLAGADGLSAP